MGALVLSGVVSAVIGLPLLPVLKAGPVVALNADAGETVGWPALVRTVAAVHQPGNVVLTQNYGEVGAVDSFGPVLGLPSCFNGHNGHNGHNGYAAWGPPPKRDVPVVAVGFPADQLQRWFRHCGTVRTHRQRRRSGQRGARRTRVPVHRPPTQLGGPLAADHPPRVRISSAGPR